MTLAAVAFLAGVLLVQYWPALPALSVLVAIVIAAGLAAWRRYLWVAFLLVGVTWASGYAMVRLAERLPERLAGVDMTVTGVVADLPEQHGRHARFDFAVVDESAPARLRLSWYRADTALKVGQQWRFTVRLKPPHGSSNPGGFDYERWLLTLGIGATGYVREYPQPLLLGQHQGWFNVGLWRQAIGERWSAQADHIVHTALLKALTIGDGGDITPAQWDIFRRTGTTHLVVISGSHIGLIAGLTYWLTLRSWAWLGWLAWPPQRVAAVAAMLAGFAYALLAGFSVPSQRAVVMLVVLMLAIIRQRHMQSFNTLALALLAVLLFDPLAVLSPGFWLSFVAVAVIVYTVAGRLGKPGAITEAVKLNVVTSLGLAPLLLLFFQQISLCSPLANLVAVPVIGVVVVPAALLTVLLMLVWPAAAEPLLALLDQILQLFYRWLELMAALPHATLALPQPPVWSLLFAVPGVLVLLAPPGWPARWSGCVLLLPMVFAASEQPAPGQAVLTMLDVGQGLAVVVETANHRLVYDTGAKFAADSDSGLSVLLPFLRLKGVQKLDRLIVSHGDNDHIGGAASLLREIPAEQVLTSATEQLSDYSPAACRAGQSWQWDGVSFTLLAPAQPVAGSADNNESCVLKIDAGRHSALLTGDIEAGAEKRLVDAYPVQLASDVLLAPHHGSHTSSTWRFLQAVRPDTVLISAGYRNRFGHPHRDVLARYRRIGAQWLTTADGGALTVRLGGETLSVLSQRGEAVRYWRHQ